MTGRPPGAPRSLVGTGPATQPGPGSDQFQPLLAPSFHVVAKLLVHPDAHHGSDGGVDIEHHPQQVHGGAQQEIGEIDGHQLEWITASGIETALIEPGKPWKNRTDESFNGKLRDECLSLEWFRSRREAAVITEAWRRHYNAVRPHSSLNDLTPSEFKQGHQTNPETAII